LSYINIQSGPNLNYDENTIWYNYSQRLISTHAFYIFWCRSLDHQTHSRATLQRMSNLTSSTVDKSFWHVHYEKCLCSVLLNKTKNSKNCITDIELRCSRILPLLSFVLQICVVRELFTLSGDFNCKLIYIAWIAFFFTFIGLAIGIYWDNCYHNNIDLAILLVWIPLSLLSTHDFVNAQKRDEALRDEWFYIHRYRSERDRSKIKSWREIL